MSRCSQGNDNISPQTRSCSNLAPSADLIRGGVNFGLPEAIFFVWKREILPSLFPLVCLFSSCVCRRLKISQEIIHSSDSITPAGAEIYTIRPRLGARTRIIVLLQLRKTVSRHQSALLNLIRCFIVGWRRCLWSKISLN